MVIKSKISGHETNALLDTGAGCCVIDLGTVEKFKLTSAIEEVDNNSKKCIDASGNEMAIIGKIKLNTSLIGVPGEFLQEFRVLAKKSNSSIILGCNFLKRYDKLTVDFRNGRIKVGKTWLKGSEISKKQNVMLQEDVVIPARSEKVVTVQCNIKNAFLGGEFRPKKTFLQGMYVSRAEVIPDVNGKFRITVLNTNEEEIRLKKRFKIGSMCKSCNMVSKVEILNRGNFENISSDTVNFRDKVKYGNQLNEIEKLKLKDLVSEYNDIFASDPKSPKRTNLVEHRIETEGEINYQKPRRIPFAWEDDVDRQVSEMLANNIIRPSKSPWNSPIL